MIAEAPPRETHRYPPISAETQQVVATPKETATTASEELALHGQRLLESRAEQSTTLSSIPTLLHHGHNGRNAVCAAQAFCRTTTSHPGPDFSNLHTANVFHDSAICILGDQGTQQPS